MRVWVVSFLILFTLFFGIAELFPWLATGAMTTPAWVIAGVLLAIASNADRPAGLPWNRCKPASLSSPDVVVAPSATPVPPPQLAPPSSPAAPRVFTPPSRSISFTIKKSNSTPRQPS